jgi:hypothetical protein
VISALELAAWEAVRAWELARKPSGQGTAGWLAHLRRVERMDSAMAHLRDVSDFERRVGALKPRRNRRLEENAAREASRG